MKNTLTLKTSHKRGIIILAGVIIIVLSSIGFFAYALKSQAVKEVTETNKDNAAEIEQDKEQDAVVITDEADLTEQLESTPQSDEQEVTPGPTIDSYGPSTKNDRPHVHAVNLTTYSLYADLLFKLQSAPVGERQAVADQFLADNAQYFGAGFNYLDSSSLHLFPQASNVSLPNSIRINSSVIDPSDPTQVIVQIVMEPTASWSILAVVKMKDSLGNFGTFEKLYIRNNTYPL